MKKLEFYTKNVYGQELFYPITYAIEIEMLTGKKTLTAPVFKALCGLGFDLVEVLPPKTEAQQVYLNGRY